jgi:hypothetical protein
MEIYNSSDQRLLEKIRKLPAEKINQVEDFVDFLYQRTAERSITLAAAKLSEPVLHQIWDNPEATLSMTTYEFGDIVLVPFPFTN